ncbi:MAG: AAA family ATPase [Bacteroidota bacterium]
MSDRLYIAATSQHVGKTTSTLGLMSAIRKRGLRVGYCKPVGQQFVDLGDLRVDKDALLFSKSMNFQLDADVHSPVIIGRGVTSEYLADPSQFDFRTPIQQASRQLQADSDFVVYEGTGHPGVGSVCDMSNAQVAQMLGAPVVMIVEGGIGSTIDKLNMNLALFRELRVPVRGVIVNKVIPKKLEKVKRFVGIYLHKMGIPLLGVLPYDKSLSSPIMSTIRLAVKGKTLLHRESMDNKVEHIASGSLLARREIVNLHNLLVIVSMANLDAAISSLCRIFEERGLPGDTLSGICVNVGDDFMSNELPPMSCRSFLEEHKIPVIATTLDTYGAAVKINEMEVKINIRTPWKVRRAVELIREHVDIDVLFR